MTDQILESQVRQIFMGKVSDRWVDRPPSAIGKTLVDGAQEIDENGFLADEQADLVNHGGHDKAIHHYPEDHYSSWIGEGQIPEGTVPAAFGENISTLGMTEWNLCVGDKLSLGSAVVQISQGRQPCWKVSEHTKNKKMAYLFQKTCRTGWYYRVLERGSVSSGDKLVLIERSQPDWSVARVTEARLTRRASLAEVEILAEMPELAEGWRKAFARMADGNTQEDTRKRLYGS